MIQIKATLFDKKGRVLSVGHNSYVKTHPIQAEYAKQAGREDAIYLHAEIDALIRCRDWEKIDSIFVERYYKDGTPALAKPCKICMGALRKLNCKIRWTE